MCVFVIVCVMLLLVTVVVESGGGGEDGTNSVQEDDNKYTKCQHEFMVKFSQCDQNYNKLTENKEKRRVNAGMFARCVVDLTVLFVDCSNRDFSVLDGLISKIKAEAETAPIDESTLLYSPTLIPTGASAGLIEIINFANKKKYHEAVRTARQAKIQKAEANSLAVLMAYKKVITNARSSDVLSTIRRDTESSNRFTQVYDEISKPKDLDVTNLRDHTCPLSVRTATSFDVVGFLVSVVVCGMACFACLGWWFGKNVMAWERGNHRLHINRLKNMTVEVQKKERQKCYGEVKALKRSINKFKASLKEKNGEIVRLQDANSALSDDIARVTADSGYVREELTRLEGEKRERTKYMRDMQRMLKKKEKVIVDLQARLEREETVTSQLEKQCDSLSAQLLLILKDTTVSTLKRRITHLQEALQKTQDLLVIAQVKDKIKRVSQQFQMDVETPLLQSMCVLCMENTVGVAFSPCGHVCSCRVCSVGLEACPICSNDIKSQLQLNASKTMQ
eukprot:m.32837 g.32837  ORF g.32837 m.32837 type:complete len:506 (-) comp9812_c0_seq1:134-1651(-)